MSLWGTFGKFQSGSNWFLCHITSCRFFFFKLLFRFTVWQRSVSACTSQNAGELCRQFSPVLHRQVHSQLWAIWGEHSNSTQGGPGLERECVVTVQTAKPACHLRSNIATTLYFKEAYCLEPFVFYSCRRVKKYVPMFCHLNLAAFHAFF